MTEMPRAGRVVASTRTDTAIFAVVELEGGARVLAHGTRARPAAGAVVSLRPLNAELWSIDETPAT